MKKRIMLFAMIMLIFIVASSFDFSYASSDEDKTEFAASVAQAQAALLDENIENMQSKNVFEQVMVEFALSFGDYAHDFLSKIFGEDITIDTIIFNETKMLNANLFIKNANSSESDVTVVIRDVVNKWFENFRMITLVIVMASIVVAGIRIIFGTPNSKTDAKTILTKCVMAVFLMFFFPYVMKYAFDINEAIITSIRKGVVEVAVTGGSKLSSVSDLKVEELEERSPKYISGYNNKILAGSEEATELYMSKIDTYAESLDVMRLMRAFAGVTLRFMYIIIWYILLVQTYILVVIYVKRYLKIAFLIAIYPLVIIGYVTGYLKGEAQSAFNRWNREFFTTVFLQTIHAITYGVISGVVMNQIKTALATNINNINWLVMIIAVSFLFTGEKILTRFWKVSTTSDRQGITNFLKMPKRVIGTFK